MVNIISLWICLKLLHTRLFKLLRTRLWYAERLMEGLRLKFESEWISIAYVYFHDDVIKWKHFPRNWPFVRGKFPTQRPVTRRFDVSFDLGLNKQLRKRPWGWWFERPSWSLWRHCKECRRHYLGLPCFRIRMDRFCVTSMILTLCRSCFLQ